MEKLFIVVPELAFFHILIITNGTLELLDSAKAKGPLQYIGNKLTDLTKKGSLL